MKLTNIAIYKTHLTPMSMVIYTKYVSNYLIDHGIKCIFFSENDTVPKEVDVIWDPRAVIPFNRLNCKQYKFLKKTAIPIVITSHGANMTYLPLVNFANSLLEFPQLIKSKYRIYYRWKTFRNYKYIITPSNYSKFVLVNNLSIASEKIVPIYHGANFDMDKIKPRENKKFEYFLHVSNYKKIKNVIRIINAFKSLKLNLNIKLILVVPGFKGNIFDGNIQIIKTHLPHDKLGTLYKNAIALIFPSLAETFGLPIIEAMKCGCPVITSNHLPVFKEIGGRAAIYVNPYSYKHIAQAMKILLNDYQLRNELIKLGVKRASKFSWQKCGSQHLKLFEKLINS